MIFTDSEGREYEKTPEDYVHSDFIVIRPVKQEPKYKVTSGYYSDVSSITITVNPATKDQAQLIKEAVEALMEYITDSDFDANNQSWFSIEADKARQSIMRENN